MNQLKVHLINQLVSLKKAKWKSYEKVKIAIAVNQYFTIKQWTQTLTDYPLPEIGKWEIVYCKSKIDVYRYVPEAKICFIFGLGDFLLSRMKSPKMVYFPLLGTEYLTNKNLPQTLTIHQPPPFSAQSIAEYCIAMAIILTRNLHKSFENRYLKIWEENNIIPDSIGSITQCKIGVLGLGRVGTIIAENFQNLKCNVTGCDKVIPQNANFIDAYYPSNKLYDFIDKIDILIVALPLNEETKHILDVKALKLLGRNKFLINVSRGEIIDEQAMIELLSSKELKGAVLDVFNMEPLKRNSALYRCKNVILTPHIAGNINLFVNEIQHDFIRKAITYNNNV